MDKVIFQIKEYESSQERKYQSQTHSIELQFEGMPDNYWVKLRRVNIKTWYPYEKWPEKIIFKYDDEQGNLFYRVTPRDDFDLIVESYSGFNKIYDLNELYKPIEDLPDVNEVLEMIKYPTKTNKYNEYEKSLLERFYDVVLQYLGEEFNAVYAVVLDEEKTDIILKALWSYQKKCDKQESIDQKRMQIMSDLINEIKYEGIKRYSEELPF